MGDEKTEQRVEETTTETTERVEENEVTKGDNLADGEVEETAADEQLQD